MTGRRAPARGASGRKITRFGGFPVLVAALLAAIGVGLVVSLAVRPEGPVPPGGSFDLVDDQGRPRRDTDFRGKLMVVYFGYTTCPDACPTALQAIASAEDTLGAKAADVATLFVTVDPERDTVDHLKGYAEQFRPDFIGLTGTAEQVAQAAKAYRIVYRKSGTGPAYLMDHTSIIHVMDRQGRFLATLNQETPPQQIAAVLKRYL